MSAHEDRRAMPHDVGAEMAVLGGVLLRNDALDLVRDSLRAEDFYQPTHQRLFLAFCAMRDRREPIDPVTLRHELTARGCLEAVGGMTAVDRLLDEVHTTANIEDYARLVRDMSLRRATIFAAHETAAEAAAGGDDDGRPAVPAEILQRAQSRFADVGRRLAGGGYEMPDAIMPRLAAYIETRQAARGEIPGLRTGYAALDQALDGLRPGALVIAAARPGVGKTTLALNIALNVAEAGHLVYFASQEMTADQIWQKLLCATADISQNSLRRGLLGDAQLAAVARTREHLATLPLATDATPAMTPAMLRAKLRRLQADRGAPALVVVDYLQRLRGDAPHYDRTEREFADVSGRLKDLALEFACPVLALAQLNRQLESRLDKHPTLADLRESGALEQDADVVALLYRDALYHGDTPDPTAVEINIAKNREGPTSKIKLHMIAEQSRFE